MGRGEQVGRVDRQQNRRMTAAEEESPQLHTNQTLSLSPTHLSLPRIRPGSPDRPRCARWRMGPHWNSGEDRATPPPNPSPCPLAPEVAEQGSTLVTRQSASSDQTLPSAPGHLSSGLAVLPEHLKFNRQQSPSLLRALQPLREHSATAHL